MPGLGALWDSLVDCICRPPRDEYSYPEELVGGGRKVFRVGRCPGLREDLTLVNKRGLRLQCSHYFPRHVRGKDGRLPCVIYCHCNSGSRRDAEEAICVLIPQGVSVFTLDFAGSGLSEGQWVTLGAEEVDDVACAVEHLRAGGRVSTLGLWGRSMGAVTALLYSQRDPSIAGMVLDSPFSRLTDLMLEIVQEQRLPIPRPLARLALAAMKRSVMKRAGFDITKVSPVDAVSQSFIPALFGHATGDTFIRITHAEALFAAYAGDKNLIRFDGDHNSRRPEFFYNSVSIFWHNTLRLEDLLEPADIHLSTPTSPGQGAAAARTAATPRSLRPPPPSAVQPRVRQPLSPIPAAPASAGAAAVSPPAVTPGSAEGSGRSSSGSEALGTGGGGGGGKGPMAAGVRTGGAGGAGQRGGGGGSGEAGGGEDEGADVAGPNGAPRSAPWEPRLWEMDLDKALMERQRFRRMAGGLPSPPGTSADAAPAGPGGVGHFRNSTELRNLLANGSDDSVVRRLLGEDPQYSDAADSSASGHRHVATAASATPAGGYAFAAAAADGGAGAGGELAAGLWLPATEEEEEAQLRAALELSLLELAANGRQADEPGPGELGGAARSPSNGSVHPGQAGPGTGTGAGGSIARAAGEGGPSSASGAASQEPARGPPFIPGLTATETPAASGDGQRQQPTQKDPMPMVGPGGSDQQQQPQGLSRQQLSNGRVAGSGRVEGPAAGDDISGNGAWPAAAADGQAASLRSSLMFPAGPMEGPQLRPSSLGGRSFSHEDARSPGTAPGLAPPPLSALSGPQQPTRPAGEPSGAPRQASPTGGQSAGMPALYPSPVPPNAYVGGAAEASLYDLYTEEELLELAVQLSLQESGGAGAGGAGSGAAPPPPPPTASLI